MPTKRPNRPLGESALSFHNSPTPTPNIFSSSKRATSHLNNYASDQKTFGLPRVSTKEIPTFMTPIKRSNNLFNDALSGSAS